MDILKVKQTYVRVTIVVDVQVTSEDDFQTVGEFINSGAEDAVMGACDYGMPFIDRVKVTSKSIEKEETFVRKETKQANDTV